MPDPANPQSLNRYSYVENNPVNRIDPTGHVDCDLLDGGGDTQGCSDSSPTPSVPSTTQIEPTCTDFWCLSTDSARTPLNLEEWEIQLLILVAFYETQGQSPVQTEHVAWILLNRYASSNYGTLENLLMSGQYHVSFGDPTGPSPTGIFTYYEDLSGSERANAAYNWYRNHFKGGLVSDERDSIIRGVVTAYDNGGEDPTHGATFFAHGTYDWVMSASAGLREEAERRNQAGQLTVGYVAGQNQLSADHLLYNNLYYPPFGQYPQSP